MLGKLELWGGKGRGVDGGKGREGKGDWFRLPESSQPHGTAIYIKVAQARFGKDFAVREEGIVHVREEGASRVWVRVLVGWMGWRGWRGWRGEGSWGVCGLEGK